MPSTKKRNKAANAKRKTTLGDLQKITKSLAVSHKKTEESLRKSQQKTEESLRQTDKKMRESLEKTQKEMRESQHRTEVVLERLSENVEKNSRDLNLANGNFNNKWGSFLEKLVAGDLVSLLQDWEIPVEKIISQKIIYTPDKNPIAEYDLIAHNGDTIVVVEVKATLTKGKIDAFLKKMESYKKENPYAENKKLFGGMAFLEAENAETENYAVEQGFLLSAPRAERPKFLL